MICPKCDTDIDLTKSGVFTRHSPGINGIPSLWAPAYCESSWRHPSTVGPSQ